MKEEWKLLETIVPDLLGQLERRFRILQNIYWHEPVGRRLLSEKVNLTERALRTEIDFLKEQDLLIVTQGGMKLTQLGVASYRELEKQLESLFGMRELAKEVSERFGNRQTIIIPGNCDEDEKVLCQFGSKLAELLDETLPIGKNIIAVMGGSTMASVAETMIPLQKEKRENVFVPARGGIGETVTTQANTVCAVMATHAKGTYRTLFVPEQVRPETYELLIKEPAIQEVLELIENANCVIHSVGNAMHMARRRKLGEEILRELKQKKAVAESFGFFYNGQGQLVYKIPRIGLQLEQLKKTPLIYAVAGGKSKAKVLQAYMKNAPKQTCLITDEACAKEILTGLAPLK